MKQNIEIHGHRGCRGLFPENTIPAFLEASRLQVDYLELDVVASGDNQIVVSHEPFFSNLITSDGKGVQIGKQTGLELNIYQMNLDEIQSYDVGSIRHPKYLEQQSVACCKPTLHQVVTAVRDYCQANRVKIPRFNIEVKFDFDQKDYYPNRKDYASLFLENIATLGIENESIIQCFDTELLNIMHEINPSLKYGILVDNFHTPQSNLGLLDFIPFGYMPNYKLANEATAEYCNKQNLNLIVWTVNNRKDIIKMKALGVNGIISDYPNRLLEFL